MSGALCVLGAARALAGGSGLLVRIAAAADGWDNALWLAGRPPLELHPSVASSSAREPCSTSTSQPTCSSMDRRSHCHPGFAAGHALRHYAVNNKPTLRYVAIREPKLDRYTTEPTNYVQLLMALKRAQDPQRLQHLITTYADRFDAVHVAAALVRLPKVLEYRPQDLVSQDVVVPGGGVQPFRPRPGAQLRASHADGGAQVLALLLALLPFYVQHFYPRQAATVVWALGKLAYMGVVTPPVACLEDLLIQVKANNFRLLRVHGQALDVAQLLQGLAKVQHKDDALVAELARMVQQHASGFRAREAAMATWGLAMLGHTPAPAFNALADALLARLAQARPGNGHGAPPLPSAAASLLWAYAKAGCSRTDLFEVLVQAIMAQRVIMTPQDAATAAWACAALGYRNDTLLAVLGDVARATLERWGEREASSMLESLARLGYVHEGLLDAVVASIRKEEAVSAEPADAARVLWALARSGRGGSTADADVVHRLVQAAVTRMPRTPAHYVAQLCEALETWRYSEQETLTAIATRTYALIDSISGAQLCSVLGALDAGGAAYAQLAVAVVRTLPRLMEAEDVTPQQAVQLMHHCARQAASTPEAARAVLDYASSASAGGLDGNVDHAARVLCIVFNTPEHERQADPLLRHRLAAAAQQVVQAQQSQMSAAAASALAEAAAKVGQAALFDSLLQQRRAQLGAHTSQQITGTAA